MHMKSKMFMLGIITLVLILLTSCQAPETPVPVLDTDDEDLGALDDALGGLDDDVMTEDLDDLDEVLGVEF
jgi:hypothetical protein